MGKPINQIHPEDTKDAAKMRIRFKRNLDLKTLEKSCLTDMVIVSSNFAQPAATHDNDGREQLFLVGQYTDKIAHLSFYLLLWLVIAAIGFFFVAIVPSMGELEWTKSEYQLVIGIAAVFLLAITMDTLMVVRALLSRKPALVIDTNGVHGFTGGFWRSILWEDLGYVYFKGGNSCIVQKPRNAIDQFAHRFTWKGGWQRWKYEFAVTTPLKRIDVSEKDIRKAIAARRPDALSAQAGTYQTQE